MAKRDEDDIRNRNRAGLLQENADGSVTALQPDRPDNVPRPIALDLDAAYERYKAGKGFGRADLFRILIDEIKGLKARIGAVDETAVLAISDRVESLERVIGNALRPPIIADPEVLDPDIHAAANSRGGWPKGKSRKVTEPEVA